MASEVQFLVGVIDTPGSIGPMVVETDDQPQALLFFGTNFTAYDTVVTTDGLGLFRGMCGPKWDTRELVQNAASFIGTPAGNAHSMQNHAIHILDTSGGATILYEADVTSIDPESFTLNWTVAASGYKVVWVGVIGIENDAIAAGVGMTDGTAYDVGFKAGAGIIHGGWSGPDAVGTTRTQEWYGGGSYPGTNDLNWSGCGATNFCFPTSNSAQYLCELFQSNPTIIVTSGAHFTGPFLTSSNIKAYPSGTTDFVFAGDVENGGMWLTWDDEDARCFIFSPADADEATNTKTGLPFAPGLLLGYTISDEPDGQGTGGRGGLGLSVVHDDLQWCATIDGKTAQGGFQSLRYGFCDRVNVGVHAGEVELTEDGFILTTKEASVSNDTVVWHAFGHPRPRWRPQIYRLVRSL